jgi:L-lactate utilization protein LutB
MSVECAESVECVKCVGCCVHCAVSSSASSAAFEASPHAEEVHIHRECGEGSEPQEDIYLLPKHRQHISSPAPAQEVQN